MSEPGGVGAPFVEAAGRLARSIEAELRGRADPARQEVTRSYFPSELEILGVSAGDIRAVIRAHQSGWRALPPEAVITLAETLHAGGTHEGRQAGYEILENRTDTRPLLDRGALERLGSGNDNWASVDTFATRVAGPAWREGRIDDAVVRGWASASDPWWRRTAVVCTVALNMASRGGEGDTGRTIDLCERVIDDAHPMVVKALSWGLRSLVPRDPAAVRAFLDRHGDRVPARVRREVAHKIETGRKSG